MAKQEFHLDFCGRGITVETGEIAKQADGAVIIRYGDTVLDAACGLGYGSSLLYHNSLASKVIGIDGSKYGLPC